MAFCGLLSGLVTTKTRSRTDEALKLWLAEQSSSEFKVYGFSKLAAATGNFADENRLGQGSFGPVYKGQLPDGVEVAVKRLSAYSLQGLQQFKNEIQLIPKLQHPNLIRLLGCCVQEEELLVYEYMPNRSLDLFIFDQQRRLLLDWEKRFRIIEGVAQGLLHLHDDSPVCIMLRDLKASDILLDKDFNPKISDFGMAGILGSNTMVLETDTVVGASGFMAPEYACGGLLSVKTDVYGFGVLLLEILTGKRARGRQHYGKSGNLVEYAWELWMGGRLSELIDTTLIECRDDVDMARILQCVKLALLCMHENPTDRPAMADVAAVLAGRRAVGPEAPAPRTLLAQGSGGDD